MSPSPDRLSIEKAISSTAGKKFPRDEFWLAYRLVAIPSLVLLLLTGSAQLIAEMVSAPCAGGLRMATAFIFGFLVVFTVVVLKSFTHQAPG
jgi:uncharacterized membrane protein YhaH (DUF805 family)